MKMYQIISPLLFFLFFFTNSCALSANIICLHESHTQHRRRHFFFSPHSIVCIVRRSLITSEGKLCVHETSLIFSRALSWWKYFSVRVCCEEKFSVVSRRDIKHCECSLSFKIKSHALSRALFLNLSKMKCSQILMMIVVSLSLLSECVMCLICN
jgi:hypothetical protein